MDATGPGKFLEDEPCPALPVPRTFPPSRLKLLALTQVDPSETTNGTALRVRPLLEWLRKRHQVTLLCASSFAPAARPRQNFTQRLLGLADFTTPYEGNRGFQDAVRKAVEAESFDALLLFGAEMLQYIPPVNATIVADLVDEPVLAALRNLKSLRGWQAVTMAKQALSLVWYERHWRGRLSSVLVVAERDARAARRIMPRVPVRHIANGVDVDYFSPAPHALMEHEIVFSGNMAFPPNVAACLYFAEHIFPLIRKAEPLAHWTIVGNQPHEKVRELAGREGIAVTGWVPDIRPYLDRAAVYVSPLITGSGIKNKILEAWAMQKAVVATPLGCAGVPVRDGVNLVVAGSAASFADHTLALLRDPQRAAALGREARRTVEAEYRWQDKAAELEDALLTAVRRR